MAEAIVPIGVTVVLSTAGAPFVAATAAGVLVGFAADAILNEIEAESPTVPVNGLPPVNFGKGFYIHVDEAGNRILVPNGQLPKSEAECFLSGTSISLANGGSAAIEAVSVGDWLLSYSPDGKLVPARVSRVFTQVATHMLDLHGTFMTPGHVTLCGRVEGEDHPFAGRHVPILDILRTDGALVAKDGSLVRAATACPVGSDGDRMVEAFTGDVADDGTMIVRERGLIRLGTRHVGPDGQVVRIQEVIAQAGLHVREDGRLTHCPHDPDAPCFPLHWAFGKRLPRPEDYVLTSSDVTLAEIYAAGEWEGQGTYLPGPDEVSAGQAATAPEAASDAIRPKPRPNIPLRLQGKTRMEADGTLTIDPTDKPVAEIAIMGNTGPSSAPQPVNRRTRRAAEARMRASVH